MDNGEIFEKLLRIAQKNNMQVKFVSFRASKGLLTGDRIGIGMDLSIDDIIYTFAHELAHLYLHYDKGDTIKSPKHDEYEERADRAAKMLLDVLI